MHLGGAVINSAFTSNSVSGSVGRALFAPVGSDGNTFTNNAFIRSSIGPDVDDDTVGGGTAGTANTYSGNSCGTSDPGGLC
jgi:hypothetical protein